MLTVTPSTDAPTGGRRSDVARSLIWPTIRVARLDRIASTVALGSIPMLVMVARNGTDLAVPTIVLGIVTGASIGWVADDPTADLLTPCPVNTPRRIASRVLLAVVAACTIATIVMLVAAGFGSLMTSWTERIPEALVASSVALGAGLSVLRRGDPLGGATGVTAGVAVPVVIAALAFRWPDTIPSFGSGPAHTRWWILAAIGALVAVHRGSDPATTRTFQRAFEDR